MQFIGEAAATESVDWVLTAIRVRFENYHDTYMTQSGLHILDCFTLEASLVHPVQYGSDCPFSSTWRDLYHLVLQLAFHSSLILRLYLLFVTCANTILGWVVSNPTSCVDWSSDCLCCRLDGQLRLTYAEHFFSTSIVTDKLYPCMSVLPLALNLVELTERHRSPQAVTDCVTSLSD